MIVKGSGGGACGEAGLGGGLLGVAMATLALPPPPPLSPTEGEIEVVVLGDEKAPAEFTEVEAVDAVAAVVDTTVLVVLAAVVATAAAA